MLAPSHDSVLAILAEFGPSLLVVAPFVPALILALALLALSARRAPAPVAILAGAPIRPRRQAGLRDRPELLAAALALAFTIAAAGLVRGFTA